MLVVNLGKSGAKILNELLMNRLGTCVPQFVSNYGMFLTRLYGIIASWSCLLRFRSKNGQ